MEYQIKLTNNVPIYTRAPIIIPTAVEKIFIAINQYDHFRSLLRSKLLFDVCIDSFVTTELEEAIQKGNDKTKALRHLRLLVDNDDGNAPRTRLNVIESLASIVQDVGMIVPVESKSSSAKIQSRCICSRTSHHKEIVRKGYTASNASVSTWGHSRRVKRRSFHIDRYC